MPSRVRVSAPGKSIVMGEHSAVYHRPALAAAVDRRSVAEVFLHGTPGRLRLDLPQVDVKDEVTWSDVLDYTRACRRAWQRYREHPDPETLARMRGTDPAHLVKVALGEAAEHLGNGDPPGMAIRLDSEIPLGSGFGSSAAATVALTEAYLAMRGATLEPKALHRLTLEAERRQHGLPSGVDNATVIHGGLVWARKRASGETSVEALSARPRILEDIRVFHTGEPAETTGAVVDAVRRRRQSDPDRYDHVLDRMEEATRSFRQELEQPTAPSRWRVIALMRDFEACLEELGVVPEPIREIVREIEGRGGAAKVSGAGALSGHGAGSLMVYHPDGSDIDRWDFLGGLEPLDLTLGAEGVRRETVE